MKKIKYLGMSLLFLLVYTATLRADGEPIITEIVVFGESSSDTGNVFDLTCDDPMVLDPPCFFGLYYNGRLSNGPIWIDRLADWLGVTRPEPSNRDGSNYAHAGAKSFDGVNTRVSLFTGLPLDQEVPQIGQQIEDYLVANPDGFRSDQLVVIWGGANDLRDIEDVFGVINLVTALTSHVQTVLANEATQVLVLNQLPADLAPFFTIIGATQEQRDMIRQLIVGFNGTFEASIKESFQDDEARVHFIDAFSLTFEIGNHPEDFGLTNVTDSALNLFNNGMVAPNPDEYLFWDPIHPTTAFYTSFAELVQEDIVNNLLDDLLETLEGIELIDPNGNRRAGLNKKLSSAKTKFANGKLEAAAKKLEGFKKKVEKLVDDGQIDPNDALKLDGDADYTIALLRQIQS